MESFCNLRVVKILRFFNTVLFRSKRNEGNEFCGGEGRAVRRVNCKVVFILITVPELKALLLRPPHFPPHC